MMRRSVVLGLQVSHTNVELLGIPLGSVDHFRSSERFKRGLIPEVGPYEL